MTPIDIIANAIRADHGLAPTSGVTLDNIGGNVATALNALVDPDVVAYAAQALRDDDGSLGIPNAVRHMSSGERRVVALVVLHSIVAEVY